MKRTTNSLRVLSSMVAVALLGLVVGSPAWGQDDLLGSYTVPFGKYTNSEHRGAIYAVEKSPHASNQAILVFTQVRRPYKNQVFVCENATWNEKEKFYSCPKPVSNNGKNFIETLSIGDLNGDFCDKLRNDARIGNKIIKPIDCKPDEKCTCFQVKHWVEHPGFAPSPGAGTGKDN